MGIASPLGNIHGLTGIISRGLWNKDKLVADTVNRSEFLVTDPTVRKVFHFCNRLENEGRGTVFSRKRERK